MNVFIFSNQDEGLLSDHNNRTALLLYLCGWVNGFAAMLILLSWYFAYCFPMDLWLRGSYGEYRAYMVMEVYVCIKLM